MKISFLRFTRFVDVSTYLLLLCLAMASCSKGIEDPNPPAKDSIDLISSESIYHGGDSLNMTYMSRNIYFYDTVNKQVVQTTYDSISGGHGITNQIVYHYDTEGRLSELDFTNTDGPFKQITFLYDHAGNLEKSLYADFYYGVVENEFSTEMVNGNKVITQYDTLGSNIGKGVYYAARPGLTRYLFNSNGNLINQYYISTNPGTADPANHDTSGCIMQYDGNGNMTDFRSYSTSMDASDHLQYGERSVIFTRANSSVSPVKDLIAATLRNLSWLLTPDYVSIFGGPTWGESIYLPREIPFSNSYEDFGDHNYTCTYINQFDSNGLLMGYGLTNVEHNIYNSGTSTHEVHYFTYIHMKKNK